MRRMLRADGVAITVGYLTDNRITLCASDEVAHALESLQEVTGEGPGYEAARNGAMVVAELDGDADERWPLLTQTLEERYGPLKVYAVPVHAGGALGGVATLYTRPHGLPRRAAAARGLPGERGRRRAGDRCLRALRRSLSRRVRAGARGAWSTRRPGW